MENRTEQACSMPEPSTAMVNIAPGLDPVVVALAEQVMGLLTYARQRTVATDDDVKLATDDLSIMSRLKKAIEEKRQEYVGPLNAHLKDINEKFKLLSEPLAQADKVTRDKVLLYRAEVERKRKEIEEINRQAEELARKQAALNNGEFTVDTTPVIAPEAPPAHVRTDSGTLGQTGTWDFEIVDMAIVPKEYLIVNETMVKGVIRGSKGKLQIPGIKNVWKPGLRVTTR